MNESIKRRSFLEVLLSIFGLSAALNKGGTEKNHPQLAAENAGQVIESDPPGVCHAAPGVWLSEKFQGDPCNPMIPLRRVAEVDERGRFPILSVIQWIPVAERMPEINRIGVMADYSAEVLVLAHRYENREGYPGCGQRRVGVAVISGLRIREKQIDGLPPFLESEHWNCVMDDDVIAWAEMPKDINWLPAALEDWAIPMRDQEKAQICAPFNMPNTWGEQWGPFPINGSMTINSSRK